jgi:hypothetical protein
MNWRIYLILVIFALFFIILIFNPNLSCFGRRIRSPLYPLFRRKKKEIKTEDYDFSLVDEKERKGLGLKRPRMESGEKEPMAKKKELKTEDYGFSVVDDQGKRRPKEGEEKGEKKED